MKSLSRCLIVSVLGLVPFGGEAQAQTASQPPKSSRAEGSIDELLYRAGPLGLPGEAQSSISGALGRDIHSYQAHAQGAGFRVENGRHKLVVDFTSEGAAMRTGSRTWGLALRGFGYGNALKAVDTVFPKANLNRVEYQHQGLTEWYINGPLGLEQGLTVYAPPGEAGGQPLTISFALSGNLRAAVDGGKKDLTLSARDQQAVLRYIGLTAFDATGMPLHAWLEFQGERLLLKIAETEARYPIVIDPLVQLAELTASDGGLWDQFGYSVAVSGNTVVVGSRGNTFPSEATGDDRGAVYVFVKPTTGWANMTETAKLWASDGKPNDCLGTSVYISGNTVVAGADHCYQDTGTAPGAAYVFVKPSGGWVNMTETAKLTPSDGFPLDFFGYSIAISGNTVVVGTPTATSTTSPGAVYVFVKPTTGWTNMAETAKLTTNGAKARGLGSCVSISGNVVVAGTVSYLSATYVFVMPLTGWRNMGPTAKLGTSSWLKYPITSVSIDNNTVVAGSRSAIVAGYPRGAGYVYVMPPGGWADMDQSAVLTASDGARGDGLGNSASIVGNTVVLGAPDATIGGNASQGAAYMFVKPTTGWADMTETAKVTSGNGRPYDLFGWSVAFGGASPIIVVGAIENVSHYVGNGKAYVFH